MSTNATYIAADAATSSLVGPPAVNVSTGPLGSATQPSVTSTSAPTTTVLKSGYASISSTQRVLVRTCLSIVEEHRKGNITHAQATIQIFGILPDDRFGTEAFASYVEQLSQTDRDRHIAFVRGASNLPIPRANPTSGSSAPSANGEPVPSTDCEPPAGERPVSPVQASPNLKRSVDQALGAADEGRTRVIPNESMYPWTDVPIVPTSVDPDIVRTLALRANYHVNVRRAKHTLIIRADCPTFPDALWTDVLLDKYVDLDRIFSG